MEMSSERFMETLTQSKDLLRLKHAVCAEPNAEVRYSRSPGCSNCPRAREDRREVLIIFH